MKDNIIWSIYIDKNDYADGVVQYLGLKFENGDIKQQKIIGCNNAIDLGTPILTIDSNTKRITP